MGLVGTHRGLMGPIRLQVMVDKVVPLVLRQQRPLSLLVVLAQQEEPQAGVM